MLAGKNLKCCIDIIFNEEYLLRTST